MLRQADRQVEALTTIQQGISLRLELVSRPLQATQQRAALRKDVAELIELCRVWKKRKDADTPTSDEIWPADPIACYYVVLALRTLDDQLGTSPNTVQ